MYRDSLMMKLENYGYTMVYVVKYKIVANGQKQCAQEQD